MGASETVSALSDLLNSQPMTARQAAEKAERDGIDLRYGTLAGYWAGNHGRPTRASLAKLAKVVPQLSEEQLQQAAWGKPAPLGPYQPTEESVHLTGQQRRALDQLIKSIVDAEGDTHARPSVDTAFPPAPTGTPVQAGPAQEDGDRTDSTNQGESGTTAARLRDQERTFRGQVNRGNDDAQKAT